MKKPKPKRHIFISPHLDDAVLSAGNLLIKLCSKDQSVVVITAFTTFGAYPPNDSANAYIRSCGYSTSEGLQKQRHKEEHAAMKLLHAKPIFLNLTDGLFRIVNSSISHSIRSLLHRNQSLYPSFQALMSGQVSAHDTPLIKSLEHKLRLLIQDDDAIYAPLGIGNHVDHIIVHKVVRKVFGHRAYFWLDQPYALTHRATTLKDFRLRMTLPSTPEKTKILRSYSSQIPFLFPKGIYLISERFYRLDG